MNINQDIIIFGGNSVLAQNFRSNFNSDSVNFINITRSRKNSNDIFCDTGKFMNQGEIDKLNNEINSKIVSKIRFLYYSLRQADQEQKIKFRIIGP